MKRVLKVEVCTELCRLDDEHYPLKVY